MTKQEAIEHFGTQARLAAALGISQPTVSGWVEVPKHHQYVLERLTGGALKADWPEIVAATEQPGSSSPA